MTAPGSLCPPSCVDRRHFLGVGACTLLGLALGGCASLVARRVAPIDGRIVLSLQQYPELADGGGSLKLVAEGEPDPIYILAQGDGTFAALSPICTHLGCTVEIEGQRLVCPCHGSIYDRSGKVLQGPAEQPLVRFHTRVSPDGELTIDLRNRA